MLDTAVDHQRAHFDTLSRFPSIRPLCTSREHGWDRVVAYIGVIQRRDVFCFNCQHHSVNFHLNGRVRVRWQCSEHSQAQRCGPGAVTIVPAGQHRFEVSGPCKFLSWVLDPGRIAALAGEEEGSPDLRPLFAGDDPALWSVGEALASELNHPGLGSRLYVESLELGLIVQLLRRYPAASHRDSTGRDQLAAGRLRAATDFIVDHLHEDVSLLSLAGTVGMSPFHFAKLFKRATGRSPHRYLLERRVEKAKELLEEGDVPISQVALKVGFCSQSHLTDVFRRLVGVTPAVYQKACG
jgi:AraC family transcriptional regulator